MTQGRRFKLATVPEVLLGVIVDATLDAQRTRDAAQVPVALRPLLKFDRRRRTSTAVRHQVAVAIDGDEDIAGSACEALMAMPGILAALKKHDSASPLIPVIAATATDTLDLHVAALWASSPEGADTALGGAIALVHLESVNTDIEAEREAALSEVETAVEAARRAEALLDTEREKSSRLTAELREARSANRDRKDAEVADDDALRRRVQEADKAIAAALQRADRSEESLRQTNERLAAANADKTSLKAELREATRKLSDVVAVADVLRLSEKAEELGRELSRLATAGSAARTEVNPRKIDARRSPRPRVKVPGGLTSDSAEGFAGMLRTDGVLLVVDGYSVAFAGWPEATAEDKRRHVLRGLADLHRRFGCDVLCVFDGDGTAMKPQKRDGVQIVFSVEEEEADAVVVRSVEELDVGKCAIVVSSDRWVQDNSEARGATAVPSEVLIATFRTR